MTATVLITKNSEVENKITETGRLVTANVLKIKMREVENKILNHVKNISTPEFDKLTSKSFEARLKQADLVKKPDFQNKLRSFIRRITSNKTKH